MASLTLETTATVPTNTSLSITVYEDTDGDGTAENTVTATVSDGTNSQPVSGLDATLGNDYWIEPTFESSDVTTTASLDSATLKQSGFDGDPVIGTGVVLQPTGVYDTVQPYAEGEGVVLMPNGRYVGAEDFEFTLDGDTFTSEWFTETNPLLADGEFAVVLDGLFTDVALRVERDDDGDGEPDARTSTVTVGPSRLPIVFDDFYVEDSRYRLVLTSVTADDRLQTIEPTIVTA